MDWSAKAWERSLPEYKKIIDMPYLRRLADGTLPMEKFMFYIAQDDIYLEHYAKALSLIAAKCPSPAEALEFIRYAEVALVSEREMHGMYSERYGQNGAGEIQPACHHYGHFLRSTAALEPVEVGMAAILPCFWLYREVGERIRKTASANNPYQAWIDTYVGEEYDAVVDHAIGICNAAAARTTEDVRERMSEAFLMSTRLEFDFWDAAWRLRVW